MSVTSERPEPTFPQFFEVRCERNGLLAGSRYRTNIVMQNGVFDTITLEGDKDWDNWFQVRVPAFQFSPPIPDQAPVT